MQEPCGILVYQWMGAEQLKCVSRPTVLLVQWTERTGMRRTGSDDAHSERQNSLDITKLCIGEWYEWLSLGFQQDRQRC